MATKKKNIDEVLRMNMESTGLDDESLDDAGNDSLGLGEDDEDDEDGSDGDDDEENE